MIYRKTTALTGALLLSAFCVAPAPGGAGKKATYSIKVLADAAPPKDVQEPIRKLLGKRCVQLFDTKGNLALEVWLRQEVPVKATEEQIKNGLTYREIPLSTILGAVRVPSQVYDYKKQRLPAGTYTLRLATQPMDGDHMGTRLYSDFCLVSLAAADRKADLMDAKALQELSAKTTDSHPGVLLLFPGKGAGAAPTLVSRPGGHWVLLFTLDATAGGKKAKLLFGLVLIGSSASA